MVQHILQKNDEALGDHYEVFINPSTTVIVYELDMEAFDNLTDSALLDLFVPKSTLRALRKQYERAIKDGNFKFHQKTESHIV